MGRSAAEWTWSSSPRTTRAPRTRKGSSPPSSPACPWPPLLRRHRDRPTPAIGLALAAPSQATSSSSPARATRPRRRWRGRPALRRPGRWPGSSWSAPVIALLIAGAVAMLASLVGHPLPHRLLPEPRKGQPILGPEDRGPEHQHKAGTPTMGGIAILVAAVHRLDRRPRPAGLRVLRPGHDHDRPASLAMAASASSTTSSRSAGPQPRRPLEEEGVDHPRHHVLLATLMLVHRDVTRRSAFTRADSPGLGAAGSAG